MTGAVSSQIVTEEPKGTLDPVGNRVKSVKVEGCLTASPIRRAGAKAGLSDPTASGWKGRRSTDKRYSGDNRLISSERSQRRGGLAPRCRLIASWGWRSSQGFGCSPMKAVRELGLDRRETGRSLSAVGVGSLSGSHPSTRGLGGTYLWCPGCRASGSAGWPTYGQDKR